MDDIRKAWLEFEKRPFPLGHRAIVVDGQNLTVLQAEIGGYIVSYIQTEGSLGGRQRVALNLCLERLEKGKAEMTSEGKEHFDALIRIGRAVLSTAHDQPPL